MPRCGAERTGPRACVYVCVAGAAVQQRGQTAVKPAADRRCG